MGAVFEDYPTAAVAASGIWVSMAAELYFRPDRKLSQQDTINDQEKAKLEELIKDIQDFLKNAHNVVKMVKKDLPADIMSKIEKMNKEQPQLLFNSRPVRGVKSMTY